MITKNKRAWIRIIEAFVAILLITGVLLIVINKQYIEKRDVSSEFYKIEISILREIQLNDSLRKSILDIETLPVDWDNFPQNVKEKIISKTPHYLNCEAKICAIDENCMLNKSLEKDVYVNSVMIAANLEVYSPKQVKIFCWKKN